MKDAVQGAVLRWLRKPPAGLEPPQVTAWLHKTAFRLLQRSATSNSRLVRLDDEEFVGVPDVSPEQRVLVRQVLDRCANCLTGRTQDAIRRWSERQSAEEIATELSLTEGHVRLKIHRGLLKLRKAFSAGDVGRP